MYFFNYKFPTFLLDLLILKEVRAQFSTWKMFFQKSLGQITADLIQEKVLYEKMKFMILKLVLSLKYF